MAELRLIALLVTKWKLNPTSTKMILSRLPAARRQFVIRNFRAPAGGDPTVALEQYVAQCEKTNVWANAAAGQFPPTTARPAARPLAGLARPAAPGGAGLGVGLKRPLAPPNVVHDPNKRPRMMAVPVAQRQQVPQAALAARMPAARPVAARPPTQPPRMPAAQIPGGRLGVAVGRPPVAARSMGPRPGMTMRPTQPAARPIGAVGQANGAQRPGGYIRSLLNRF